MRVLVIGATGFVGSHVARALVAAGHAVAALARPQSPRDLVAGLELEWNAGDLEDQASLERAFRGRDAVVLCAGAFSLWERHAERLYRTNVLGARNVVAACRKAGVGRLVYDGTAGIYAGSPRPEPADERGHPWRERYASFHVVAMALAEAEVLRGVAAGLDAVLLHPALVVGPGDRSFHSSWLLLGAARARIGLCPPGGLNLVDVEDVARAHVLALDRARRGSIYLIGGENLTNRALFELLAGVVSTRTPIVPVPRAAYRALGSAAGLVARARGRDSLDRVDLNADLARAATLYWFVDSTRVRRELGLEPGPVKPALERQAEWLRARGVLPP